MVRACWTNGLFADSMVRAGLAASSQHGLGIVPCRGSSRVEAMPRVPDLSDIRAFENAPGGIFLFRQRSRSLRCCRTFLELRDQIAGKLQRGGQAVEVGKFCRAGVVDNQRGEEVHLRGRGR